MSLLRYPGGKGKVARQIVDLICGLYAERDLGRDYEYREPFFGSGAIGLGILERCDLVRKAWFNDCDPAISCLWKSVVLHGQEFLEKVDAYTPKVEDFYAFKEKLESLSKTSLAGLGEASGIVEYAFTKLATHQMSYSGLGVRAGGPIGGLSQKSRYDVGCRYSPRNIRRQVDKIRSVMEGKILRPEVCTCRDFQEILSEPGPAVYYLDPPYYEKGGQLYQFAFDDADHVRLADLLYRFKQDKFFLLSYDKHPVIEAYYGGWTRIREIPLTYTINPAGEKAPRKTELLISNF